MHAVCGYPVMSTWLAVVKAGNYEGWPMLTAHKIRKYYTETTNTPKGHLNKPKPFEIPNTTKMKAKKERNIHMKVYNVRKTIYSNQTG